MSQEEERVEEQVSGLVSVKKEKKEKKEKKSKSEDGEKKEKKDKKEKKERKDKKSKVTDTEPIAESSTQAATSVSDEPIIGSAEDNKPVTEEKPKKRKRKEKDGEAAEGDEDELEIDVDAPTPLSKAQARAEKKKAKKMKKEGKEDGSDDEKDAEDGEERPKKKVKKEKKKEDTEPKRKHSIWIGNLSFKATPESLKTWFERKLAGDGADVDMDAGQGLVTRVNLPMKEGRNRWGHQECRGFAYVDFESPELQQKAVELSETLLDGRKVLIKLGTDFTANPDARTPKPLSVPAGAIPKNQLHKESSSLFMGNLPFDATEEEIKDFVETNVKTHRRETLGERGDSDSGSGEDSDDEDDEDKAKKETSDDEEAGSDIDSDPEEMDFNQFNKGGPAVKLHKSGCGLKKVRMPTFEDSGKCKGFAFIDFDSPKEATYALAVRANQFFRGNRKLKLQYASENATSRSMSKNKRLGIDAPSGPARPPRYFDRSAASAPLDPASGEAGEDAPAAKKDTRGKKWETAGRPRPGAALAMAKRENVSIVESQGKKITF